MLFHKSDIKKKTKRDKTTAGMHHTESPDCDAPKPQFSMKTNKQIEKCGSDQP